MIPSLLVLLPLGQTPTFVDLPLKNVCWVAPLKNGRVVAITKQREYGPGEAHLIESGKVRATVRITLPMNGPTLTPNQDWLVLSDWNESELVSLDPFRNHGKKPGAGILRGKPAWIEWRPDGASWLVLNGRKIRAPRGREFMLIAPQGDLIATHRTLHPHLKTESRFDEDVEIWRLTNKNEFQRLRRLGKMWWDGGSTGVPSILAMTENGFAVIDQPAGGNALQFPMLCLPNRGPHHPFEKLKWEMSVLTDVPLGFRSGVLCRIWVVDEYAKRAYDADPSEVSLMDRGSDWLAWLDGEEIRMLPTPAGFLNMWWDKSDRVALSIRKGSRIEFKLIELPPRGWWTPGKSPAHR